MKEKILKLKIENPTWGYKKIAKALDCSPNTVRYYLDPSSREGLHRRNREHKLRRHPLKKKLEVFVLHYFQYYPEHRKTDGFPILNLEEALKLFGDNPRCYLTGVPIDLLKPSTYSLDHKIPICKGGKSTFENMGLTTTQVNLQKNGYTPESFIEVCKQVLENQGYQVRKPLAQCRGLEPRSPRDKAEYFSPLN